MRLVKLNSAKYDTIFHSIPPLDFVNRFVKLFKLIDLDDSTPFSKYTVSLEELRENLVDLLPELIVYIRAYKIKYIELGDQLIFHRTLTVLKYLLRNIPYDLYKNEIIKDNKKINYYRILKCGFDNKMEINGLYCREYGICIHKDIVLHFDF